MATHSPQDQGDVSISRLVRAAVAELNKALRIAAEAGIHCELSRLTTQQIGEHHSREIYSVELERRGPPL